MKKPKTPIAEEPLLLDAPSTRPPGGPQPARSYSPKQAAILGKLRANGSGQITTAEATALVGGNIYANAEAHTGALLGNMVKQGMLRRVKRGVFALP